MVIANGFAEPTQTQTPKTLHITVQIVAFAVTAVKAAMVIFLAAAYLIGAALILTGLAESADTTNSLKAFGVAVAVVVVAGGLLLVQGLATKRQRPARLFWAASGLLLLDGLMAWLVAFRTSGGGFLPVAVLLFAGLFVMQACVILGAIVATFNASRRR